MTKPKYPKPKPQRVPVPTAHNVRARIIEANPDRWRVRCDDRSEFIVEIGDVAAQCTNLPLMIVNAIVEFDLVDGLFPWDVEVVT